MIVVVPVFGGDDGSGGTRESGVEFECDELNDDFRTNELPGFKRLLFTTADDRGKDRPGKLFFLSYIPLYVLAIPTLGGVVELFWLLFVAIVAFAMLLALL